MILIFALPSRENDSHFRRAAASGRPQAVALKRAAASGRHRLRRAARVSIYGRTRRRCLGALRRSPKG